MTNVEIAQHYFDLSIRIDHTSRSVTNNPSLNGIIMIKKEANTMATRDLRISITTEDKYFVAQCLDVDVSSFGETETEALDAVREALELYFDSSDPNIEQPIIVNLKLQSA